MKDIEILIDNETKEYVAFLRGHEVFRNSEPMTADDLYYDTDLNLILLKENGNEK